MTTSESLVLYVFFVSFLTPLFSAFFFGLDISHAKLSATSFSRHVSVLHVTHPSHLHHQMFSKKNRV